MVLLQLRVRVQTALCWTPVIVTALHSHEKNLSPNALSLLSRASQFQSVQWSKKGLPRDGVDVEGVQASGRVVVLLLDHAGVDDVHDAGHGDGRLRDVGGHDAAATALRRGGEHTSLQQHMLAVSTPRQGELSYALAAAHVRA